MWYIDDSTRKVKVGSFIDFDEAHMPVPSQLAPLAAQALQRLGYCTHDKENNQVTNPVHVPKVNVHMLSSSANLPQQQ